jgi:hypothetical protein
MRKRKASRGTGFGWAFAILWVATVVFAAYGGVGWIVTLWTVSKPLAVLLAVVFAMAPLAASGMTGPAIRGGGLAAWASVLVFCGMDAAGNTNAFWAFDKLATQAENDANARTHAAAMVSYTAAKAKAETARDDATARLAKLPSSQEVCEGFGPVNCKTRQDGLAADTARIAAQREDAKHTLETLTAPVAPAVVHLLPPMASGTIHVLLSFAMVAGFLGTHSAANRQPKVTPRPKAKAKPKAKPKVTPEVKALGSAVRAP